MNLTHSNYDFEGAYTFDARREARDVQSEIDDIEALLEEWAEDAETDHAEDKATAEEDLKALRELLSGLEEIGDESPIRECDFERYARELHDDINGRDKADGWPYDYIDWPRAADALKPDYAEVDLDGVTYCYRA